MAEAQHMAAALLTAALQESPGQMVVMPVRCGVRTEMLQLAVWVLERSAAHVE